MGNHNNNTNKNNLLNLQSNNISMFTIYVLKLYKILKQKLWEYFIFINNN